MLSFDRQLDQRYDDQVRRAYRIRRNLSTALWSCAAVSTLAIPVAYFLTEHPAAFGTLAARDDLLGLLFASALAGGFGFVTAALTATFKWRAERDAEYRTFASLLADGHAGIATDRPRATDDADDAITFMHAWTDFEASAALALDRANADFDHLSPASLLHALGSNDLLDEVDVHRLRVLIRLRNAIAHGTPTAVPPAAGTLLERVKIRLGESAGTPVEQPQGPQPALA